MKNFEVVTSRENSLIKLVSCLQNSSKQRRENGAFVLEGLRLCSDAFDNGIKFDKLIVSDTAYTKYFDKISLYCEKTDSFYKIPDSLFKKISDTDSPQGIIAISSLLKRDLKAINSSGKYIALENVSDPANLGAVSRTAEALGVSGLILSSGGCDPYSPKALRSSMGTLLRIPIYIFDNFASDLYNTDLFIYSCVVDNNAENISLQEFANGSVIVIGNEANGITENTKSISNKLITIPMRGRAESLNAGAAAAIAVWEMMK